MDEREKYVQAMETLKIDKNLGENIAKRIGNEAGAIAEKPLRQTKKKVGFRWNGWQKSLAGVLALLICMTSAIGLGGGFPARGSFHTGIETAPIQKSESVKLMTASSYDDVYQALDRLGLFRRSENIYDGIGIQTYGFGMKGLTVESSDAPMPAAPGGAFNATADASTAADDYSETNLQVAGVDEADIVKTNGKTIFALKNGTLYTVSANGEASEILASLKVQSESRVPVANGTKCTSVYPTEMYLFGDTLLLVQTRESWTEENNYDLKDPEVGFFYRPYWYRATETETEVVLYDVKDPSNPSVVTASAQSGHYLSSRLVDGVLYLITNHRVYNIEQETIPDIDPREYVPYTYERKTGDADGAHEGEVENCPLEPSMIAILPNVQSSTYLVVSGVDAANGTVKGTQSILGGGTTIYMSHDNLYVAVEGDWKTREETLIREDGKEITRRFESNETDVMRIALNGGSPILVANGTVPGRPEDQFMMDEYDGTFRIVTQQYRYEYDVVSDPENEWETSENWRDISTNGVYVLNDEMKIIGRIDDLSQNERVYSVRFDGAVGYVVTFRQTDPLFAIDFSDPTNPEIRSALKIPGFSEYLHLYADGLLFGLGYSADDAGRTDEMKMSMFDVSDPFDVKEVSVKELPGYYSEALYNHKAILINAEKDLIAFPCDGKYVVYGYDELLNAFYEKGEVELVSKNGWWAGDARGLYAGGYFYVVSNGVTVLDLENLTVLSEIEFPFEENPYDGPMIIY